MLETAIMKRRDRRVLLGLAGFALLLVVASVTAFLMWDNHVRYGGLAMLLFDLDTESNIPSWFSSVLFAFLALTAWKLTPANGDRRTRMAYLALAGVFLFLSADEASTLHERIGAIVPLEGEFTKARWIILWVPAGGIVGLTLAALLWRCSPRLVLGLTLGACINLSGAVVVESFNQANWYHEAQRLRAAGVDVRTTRRFSESDHRYGNNTLSYTLGTALEEGLEMAGLITWCAVLFGERRRAAAVGRLQSESGTGREPKVAAQTAAAEPDLAIQPAASTAAEAHPPGRSRAS